MKRKFWLLAAAPLVLCLGCAPKETAPTLDPAQAGKGGKAAPGSMGERSTSESTPSPAPVGKPAAPVAGNAGTPAPGSAGERSTSESQPSPGK